MSAEKEIAQVLDAAEALCNLYVGKNAEGEQWRKTLERFEVLSKLVKAARRKLAKAAAEPRP